MKNYLLATLLVSACVATASDNTVSHLQTTEQLPSDIKKSLNELIKKVDKQSNKKLIQNQISRFIKSAPSTQAKKSALQFMHSKSKSSITKNIIRDMLKTNNNRNRHQVGSRSKANHTYKLLKNVSIIDMVTNKPKKGNLLIKNDRIEIIDYTKSIKIPESAQIFDLTGKYVIPGLIDAHVHITHGSFKSAQQQLEQAVRAGVTGVRDMGGDGRMLTLLKRNTLIGEDLGSDVYFSAIIAGPDFFKNDKRPQSVAKGAIAGEVPWQRAITHDSDLKQIIAEIKGLGATAIKVYLNVDKHLFKKVSDEAKRQGLKVWSHAIVQPTKGIDITNGGADAMSHAGELVPYEFIEGDLKTRHDFKSRKEALSYKEKLENVQWDENTPEVKKLFTAMKNNNSILDATVSLYSSKGREKDLAHALKVVRIAHEMGVKIGAGTDNMIERNHQGDEPATNIYKEMKFLTKAGLSNFEALQSATIINAEILGEKDNLGSIEKGKIANLVVLNANPLIDITNASKIDFVIKRGKIVK